MWFDGGYDVKMQQTGVLITGGGPHKRRVPVASNSRFYLKEATRSRKTDGELAAGQNVPRMHETESMFSGR